MPFKEMPAGHVETPHAGALAPIGLIEKRTDALSNIGSLLFVQQRGDR